MGKIKKVQYEDITGRKFNRLTVLRVSSKKDKDGKGVHWVCLCDCGNETVVKGKYLRSGHTKSCGCYVIEKAIQLNTTHGDTDSSFYRIWCHLKERCNNVNCKAYSNYGGRGIVHDPLWSDYLVFKKEMWFKWIYAKIKYQSIISKNNPLSIERINVNGNYTFDNCIFIPLSKQGQNTRKNKWFKAISPDGRLYLTKNQTKFAVNHGLNPKKISKCLNGDSKTHLKWIFKHIGEN